MKVIITGATGYVGRNFINSLQENSYSVYAVVLSSNEIALPEWVKVVFVDDHLEDNLSAINADIIIHLASYLTANAEKEDIENLVSSNILFGSRVLNAVKKTSLKYFINIGSYAEYHFNDGTFNPTYYYSATKTAFRSIIRYFSELSRFKVVHVVPFSIYGGKDTQKKVLDFLFDSLEAREPVKFSAGLQNLDFIHINDIVSFLHVLLENLDKVKDGDNYYLGTGKPHTIRQVAALIEKVTGLKTNIAWGVLPARERDTVYAAASISRLIEVFNWQPAISLEDGLQLKNIEANKN